MRVPSRILCAVDIDDSARSAFEQAVAIARTRDAKLLLLCAVPPEETFKQRAAERVSHLMRLRREAERAGVEVHTSVQSGPIAEIVLLHAAARQPDLIVIGVEHGRAHGWASGAVAEDVLRSSSCPTLIVPIGAPAQPSFARILTAIDVDKESVPSIDDAQQLAARYESQLTLLHVARSRTAATDALSKIQSLIPRPAGPPVAGRVAVGAVAKEVLNAARTMDADLIVIGARRRNRVGRRLFGVTRELLTDAICPVLAIPFDTVGVRRLEREAA